MDTGMVGQRVWGRGGGAAFQNFGLMAWGLVGIGDRGPLSSNRVQIQDSSSLDWQSLGLVPLG